MTHELVAAKLADLDAEAAALDRAERASRERVAAVMDPYHLALDAWKVDAEAAVLAGNVPPARPVEPVIAEADRDAAHLFQRARAELRDRRTARVRDIADDVDRETRARADVLAADLVATLAKTRGPVTELGDLAAARRAVGLPGVPLDPADVLAAIAAGRDVFTMPPARPDVGPAVILSTTDYRRPVDPSPPIPELVDAVRVAKSSTRAAGHERGREV